MKKVVTWVAEDDTTFDTEDECRLYELEQKASKDVFSQCHAWDGDFNLMTIKSDSLYWIERVTYVYCPTQEGRDALNALSEAGGYYKFFEGDTEDSVYIQWNDDNVCFEDMEKTVKQLQFTMYRMGRD